MTELRRIGAGVTLEQVEREFMEAWIAAAQDPSIERMERCVDLRRMFSAMLAEAYPPPPELAGIFTSYPPELQAVWARAHKRAHWMVRS